MSDLISDPPANNPLPTHATNSGGTVSNSAPSVSSSAPPKHFHECSLSHHPDADWHNTHVCACGATKPNVLGSDLWTNPPTKKQYAYSLHVEPDASPAVKRLVGMLSGRYAEEFTPDELRAYRDGLSAVGILVVEIESWTETPHEVVL